MPGWDSYSKTDLPVGTGGDWPDVPDDLYDAVVQDVSEPEERDDPFNPGKTQTQFYVSWELVSDDLPEGTVMRQYINIPAGVLSGAAINEKSHLYETMVGLGLIEADKPVVFHPPSWQGLEARVMVENKERKDGSGSRPRITGVKPKRSALKKRLGAK